jgi:acyl-CoA thioester hydrolase
MNGVGITYRGLVHQWNCDHMGHMNVMWYVGKFDEATWNLGAIMGMTAQYLRESKRGMAAVDHRISYRREALVGDVIIVRSAMLEVKPKSVRFVHEMFRGDGGDHLSTMLVTGVHIDIVARRSTQFEPQIVAAAQRMLAVDPQRWDPWPTRQAFLAEDP